MMAPEGFEVWSKYEDIAMHFNELLIQFRVQLLGGLAALATVGSYLVGEKVTDRRHRYAVLGLSSGMLAVSWASAACLDLFYYRQLLVGAVDALLEFEKNSRIKMSTTIERDMGCGDVLGPGLFYGIPLVSLIGIVVWSLCKYRKTPKTEG